MSSASRSIQIPRSIKQLLSGTSSKFLNITTFTTERTTSKKCKKKSPYIVCQPEIEEFPKILDIMDHNYFREEPTLKCLGLKLNSTLATRITDRLNEGNSLVAKCKYTGRILGVALNKTTKPWQSKMLAKLAETQECPKTQQLLMFYSFVESAPRLFDKNPYLFEIFVTTNVFTVKRERNYGLEQQLTEASINRAIDRKYSLFRCDATHPDFSQLLEKLKFQMEMHIPYETYVDKDGEHIFRDIQRPNIGVKIYTMDIRDKTKISDN